MAIVSPAVHSIDSFSNSDRVGKDEIDAIFDDICSVIVSPSVATQPSESTGTPDATTMLTEFVHDHDWFSASTTTTTKNKEVLAGDLDLDLDALLNFESLAPTSPLSEGNVAGPESVAATDMAMRAEPTIPAAPLPLFAQALDDGSTKNDSSTAAAMNCLPHSQQALASAAIVMPQITLTQGESGAPAVTLTYSALLRMLTEAATAASSCDAATSAAGTTLATEATIVATTKPANSQRFRVGRRPTAAVHDIGWKHGAREATPTAPNSPPSTPMLAPPATIDIPSVRDPATNEVVYECPFPSCGMRQRRRWNVVNHYKKHFFRDRSYVCDECDMSYYRVFELKRHKENVGHGIVRV